MLFLWSAQNLVNLSPSCSYWLALIMATLYRNCPVSSWPCPSVPVLLSTLPNSYSSITAQVKYEFRAASWAPSPPCPGHDYLPLRTAPGRSRGGWAPTPALKGLFLGGRARPRDAAAQGPPPTEAPRRLDRAGGSRGRRFVSGSRACPSGGSRSRLSPRQARVSPLPAPS